MFLGEHQHSVDEKSRLVMPSKFRRRLSDGLVVAKGQERCLVVFPQRKWDNESEQLVSQSRDELTVRERRRVVFGGADEQTLDKQGRVLIVEALRTYAGIDKEVSIIGVGDCLEIWDSQAWSDYSAQADVQYAGIETPAGGEAI